MRWFTTDDRSWLHPDQPAPLYHQLYQLIKRKIEAGDLRQGSLLPAETEMASFFGVSRITVKRALDELEAEGYVSRHRGRGTHVTHKHEPKVLHAPLDQILDSHAGASRETQIRLLELARLTAPAVVAEALRIGAEQLVDRAVRVRSSDGLPFAHYTSWTLPIGAAPDPEILKQPGRLDQFKRVGIHLKEVDQIISAIPADAVLAQRLQVRVGDPLLQVTRISTDQRGRPIDYLIGVYRPDRFQYRMKLSAADAQIRAPR